MANNDPTEISTVPLPESPLAIDSNDTETTPLVKNTTIWKSSPLQRLRESVVIKSKAANMILIWSAFAYLIYGTTLNPENWFVIPIAELYEAYGVTPKLIHVKSGPIIFTVLYAFIGVWLLFYPLAGYLADIRYGRRKIVIFGLKLIWLSILTFVVLFIVIYSVGIALLGDDWIERFYFGYGQCNNVSLGFGVSLTGLIVVAFLVSSTGFAAFAANVIQFGIDQLQDLPAKSSFLFIHWFLLTVYTCDSIGKLVWSTCTLSLPIHPLLSIGFLLLALVYMVFIFGMPLSLGCSKCKWFTTNTTVENPYREVMQVVTFARQHKIPIRRSAFTYWEDDIPTGLDLGKSKYGGPFTTDQVENVKAFFGILYIIFMVGPIFTADIAAAAFLPLLKNHMDIWVPEGRNLVQMVNRIFYTVVTNGTTLYSIFIVLLIPIFLKIIHPLFQRYIPGILKRIGIGLCLITVSLLCSLLVDTIGHALPSGQNTTSVFNPIYISSSTLQLSPYILIIQNVLIAVAYILIYGGVFEFICAQSPHSMKGVLIGIFFAVKGLFQLIGVLGILLPFSFWQTSPRAGLVYFLVNIVISVVGVVAFTVAAKRYQYRQRDDFCNIRKYIEEFYEKKVQHNREFERLLINISQDVQHN